MKDIHTERPKAGPIPLLSPILHCIAMTALVFLRSSFGYAFLRPKSVFFAFSWAFGLFCFAAWHEPQIWPAYRYVCFFGAAAVVLYWLQLGMTVLRDLKKSGEHDHYAGTSHFLFFARRLGVSTESAQLHLHLWGEPLIVGVAALLLRFILYEHRLAIWLFIVALCIATSELLNYWAGAVRRPKVAKDIAEDAEEQSGSLAGTSSTDVAVKPSRKEPVKMKRNRPADETE